MMRPDPENAARRVEEREKEKQGVPAVYRKKIIDDAGNLSAGTKDAADTRVAIQWDFLAQYQPKKASNGSSHISG